jgi:uncharacterized membrane protein
VGAGLVRRPVRKWTALCGAFFSTLCAAFLATIAFPTAAHAEYDICNETSYVVRAAIAFKGSDDYQSVGWFTVYPGYCRPVIDKPLTEQLYFVHARSIAGHTGPMRDWSGDEQFCIALGDFDIAGSNNCEQRGYTGAYFSQVDVGRAKSWTTTFTEPNALDLPKAQVLGLQRLLADLGYLARGSMDGYLGRSTVNAVAKFNHDVSKNFEPQPSIELMKSLTEALEAHTKSLGLQLCNQTSYAIWAAVGLPTDSDSVTTKGWFEIAPSACVRPILEPLSRSAVYIYGETVDAAEKKLYWHGADRLCTNDVMFSITARPDSCADHGLVPAAFAKLDTGGKPSWTYTFTEAAASEKSGS